MKKVTFQLGLKIGNDGNYHFYHITFTDLLWFDVSCGVECDFFLSESNAWDQGLFLFCISPSPPISSTTLEITVAAQ